MHKVIGGGGVTDVCSHDCSASRQPFAAMDQDRASFGYGLVNEPARGGEVDEKVRVVNVFDRNPQLLDPASGNVSWNGVRADRHNVGDPPLRYSSRSPSGDQTIREQKGRVRTIPMEKGGG